MQKVLNIHISLQTQTDVVFYLCITYFQFQFQFVVCFYTMPDQTWTTNFCFFNSKLSPKSNFSIHSKCERIMYLGTSGIMTVQNMYHVWA